MKLQTTNLELVLIDKTLSEDSLKQYAREYAEQIDDEVIQNTLLVEVMARNNIETYTSQDAFRNLDSLKEMQSGEVYIILRNNSLAGLFGIKPDFYNKNAEIWYWLGKDFRGRNYMGEILDKMINYCFLELDLHKLTAEVFSFNTPSINLLTNKNFEYVGCKKEDRFRKGEYVDSYIYELLNY